MRRRLKWTEDVSMEGAIEGAIDGVPEFPLYRIEREDGAYFIEGGEFLLLTEEDHDLYGPHGNGGNRTLEEAKAVCERGLDTFIRRAVAEDVMRMGVEILEKLKTRKRASEKP